VAIEEESRVPVIDFMAGDPIVLGDSVPIDVAVETLADRFSRRRTEVCRRSCPRAVKSRDVVKLRS
jgi:hypothetical protein